MLGHFVFRRLFFGSWFRIMLSPSQKAICSSRNKSQIAPNEKVLFEEKLGLILNTWSKRLCFGPKSPVFEETMKERGSMYEHFPLCRSAWGAIWGRLLQIEFSPKTVFRHGDVLWFFEILLNNWFWSGMSQKCFWSIWDYSGPIPAYPGPIMDKNRLTKMF